MQFVNRKYVIVNVDVRDQILMDEYLKLAGPAERKYGCTLVAGPSSNFLEGCIDGSFVLLSFPDDESVNAWFTDPDLADLHSLRNKASKSSIISLERF